MIAVRWLRVTVVVWGWMLWAVGVDGAHPQASQSKKSAPHVVMVIAESEYGTEKTLPKFAARHLSEFRTSIVREDPQDPNRLLGIESVEHADVLIISVRRRTLPPEQLDAIRQYVALGRPVIGIRTASHAFALRGKQPPKGRAVWPEFDHDVFGGHYTNHYGNSLRAMIRRAEKVDAVARPLLNGLQEIAPFASGGSLYKVSPLRQGTSVLLVGQVESFPAEPVAWVYRRADGGKSFYTSLGHRDDFSGDVLPRLLVNAIDWCLD